MVFILTIKNVLLGVRDYDKHSSKNKNRLIELVNFEQ